RIARKLDAKIEAVAAADPGLLDRVGRQARQRAVQSLGLAEIQAELDALALQKEELEQRERRGPQSPLPGIPRVPRAAAQEASAAARAVVVHLGIDPKGATMPYLNDGQSVEVQGSAARPYVLKNVGGVYSCSCPAWRNQSLSIERRTCKHLRALRGDAAEAD